MVWISQVTREQHVQTLQVWLELLKIGWWPCWLVVVVFKLQEWSSVLVVLKDMQATCLMVLVHDEEGLLLK